METPANFNLQLLIEEVKQSATDGVPPGKRRFCRLTGHKCYDWEKYGWRWRDVTRHAGLAANQMKWHKEKRSDDDLFFRLATLTRQLGEIPVAVDYHRAHREDPAFPTHYTFICRLGRKRKMVGALIDYARREGGWDDVVQIAENWLTLPPAPAERSLRSDPAKAGLPGEKLDHVYLLKSGRYHKIGRSKSARRRRRLIGLKMPEEVRLVHAIQTNDAPGIERYWHQRFADKRVNGEWFQLTPADVREFKRRKFM